MVPPLLLHVLALIFARFFGVKARVNMSSLKVFAVFLGLAVFVLILPAKDAYNTAKTAHALIADAKSLDIEGSGTRDDGPEESS